MLKTERLVIKAYADDDQAAMTALLTDARIKKTYMIPDLHTLEETAAVFEKLKRHSHSEEHYEKGIFADGGLIGFVNDVVMAGDQIEVGYAIHPDHWNRGFATEALLAVIDDLFSKGYREITAAAFTANMASRRVMEKCGMRQTGEKSAIKYQGRLQECVHYSIKKERQGPA